MARGAGEIKVSPAYKRLAQHFAFYGEYHTNPLNQWVHIVCVPLILLTALVFFKHISIAHYVPPAAAAALSKASIPLDGSLPLALAYAAYYLYLTPSSLGLAAAGMVGGLWYAATLAGASSWRAALVAHVFGWLAQFAGHAHEGRKPALLDNLFDALFMAPIFILIEVGFKLGLLRSFKAAIEPEIARRVAAHKASAAGGSKRH